MDARIRHNRARGNAISAEYPAAHDPSIGRAPKVWGVHASPESIAGAIGRVAGLAVLESRSGAGQWASSLASERARLSVYG